MRRLCFALALTLLPAAAFAQQAGTVRIKKFPACINAATMAATRTCTVQLSSQYAKASLFLTLVDTATVTSVTVTATCSPDNGVTYFGLSSRSISSGVATNSAFSDTIATSGTIRRILEYDARGCDYMAFAVASDGDGSDTISATVQAASGD